MRATRSFEDPGVHRQDNVMMCAAVCACVNAPACVCAVSDRRREEAVQEGGGDEVHHILLPEQVVLKCLCDNPKLSS